MPIIALASILTLGNVSLFISLFFIAAPLLLFLSGHHFVKKVSENRFITASAALLYAISPVSISAVNSGRFGILMIMILAPFLADVAMQWRKVDEFSIRKMSALSLLLALMFAFAPPFFIALLILTLMAITYDVIEWRRVADQPRLYSLVARRLCFLLAPLALTIPWSLEIISSPRKFLIDIGMLLPGGGANLAFTANPGGAGSLPWWLISPVVLILAIGLFSIERARKVALVGGSFICLATISSTFTVSGKGTTSPNYIYAGVFIALATIAALYCGVAILDKVRERLIATHVNYRHFAVSALVTISAIYAVTASGWIVTQGPQAPLQSAQGEVLPPYLAIETQSKILVLRERLVGTVGTPAGTDTKRATNEKSQVRPVVYMGVVWY